MHIIYKFVGNFKTILFAILYCYCFYTVNGFSYCYLPKIMLFNINNLFAQSEAVTNIDINTIYSIQHHSFIHC